MNRVRFGPPRRRFRSSRSLWIGVVVVGLVAVMVSTRVALSPFGLGAHAPTSALSQNKAKTPSVAAPGAGATAPSQTVATLGVYSGPGATSAARSFASSTTLPVPYAFDYFDDSSWQTISDPAWTVQRWAGAGFHMIWGVPMLPASGASLAAGSLGAYNQEFVQLARYLVASEQASSTLMLGWDAEYQGNPWYVSTPAEAAEYVAYWDQIVTSMRAVPGAEFQFEWDQLDGINAVNPDALYPGNASCTMIATDVEDVVPDTTIAAPGDRWAVIASQPYGPSWFANFASENQKTFMVGTWSLQPTSVPGGGGDDPTFVQQYLSWAVQEQVAATVVWDYGQTAVTGGSFPASAAVLAHAGPESTAAPT